MEEFDTSNLAWILYKLFYDIDETVKENNGRSYVEIDLENESFKMSGETDYNFGAGWSHSIIEKYENYLEEVPSEWEKQYNEILYRCKKLYKSVLNISLMPQAGNLQSTKKGIGNDRLDTFVWALNSYYLDENSLLFNNSSFQNTKYLKKYLALFRTEQKEESIYNYCNKIYGIESQGLVDELIEGGKEAIDSPEKIIDYMMHAYRFWRQKLGYIKKSYDEKKERLTNDERNKISNAVNEAEKILDEWFNG